MAEIIKENAPYAEFARRLRALREASGLSRDELASKCGVVGRTIINYENGTRIPYADVAAKMAAVFGLTVEDLIGMENYEQEQMKSKALENLREMYGKRGEVQAAALLEGTSSLFAGGTLTREQQEDFILEMQKLFIIATEEARAKYTPKKYRTPEKAAASQERLKKVDEINEYLDQKSTPPFFDDSDDDE
ncbi:MAG: helix-turn-helix domain-containing protein [Lachnospiraceae bacterium]|nr:helix-turn-helix domain-containing protein [Lachnospiraceae bacterium]